MQTQTAHMRCCVAFCFVSLLGITAAEARSEWTFSKLMDRLKQETSKVVSGRVIIQQTCEKGEDPIVEWVHEFQKEGNHNVLLTKIKDEKGDVLSLQIQGYSEGKRILYDSRERILMLHQGSLDEEKIPFHPPFIDWRQIGLGFCGDIFGSYEKVLSNVSGWDRFLVIGDPARGHTRFLEYEDGRLIVDHSGDAAYIEIETKGGFRVTQFRHGPELHAGVKRQDNHSEWRVEYGSFDALKLPTSAVFLCGEKKALRFTLEWSEVNAPLELGVPMLERFAELVPGAKIQD